MDRQEENKVDWKGSVAEKTNGFIDREKTKGSIFCKAYATEKVNGSVQNEAGSGE